MPPVLRPRRPAAARRSPCLAPPAAPARQRRAHPHPGLGPRVDRPARPAHPRRARRTRERGAAHRHEGRRRARGPRASSPGTIDPDDRRVTRVERHRRRPPAPRGASPASAPAWLEDRLADLAADERQRLTRRARGPRGPQRRPATRRLVTRRMSLAAKDTFRSLRMRNFRLFFVGQLISQTGHLADDGRPDPARAAADRLRHRPRPARRLPVRTRARARRLGGHRRRPQRQASPADHRPGRRDGAVLRARGRGLLATTTRSAIIYALAAVQGIITAFDNPARRAFVVEMVPKTDLPNAVSLNSAVMTGSRVVGPALAGLLVITVGFGWAFLLDAAQLRRRDLRPLGRCARRSCSSSPRRRSDEGPGPRGPALRVRRAAAVGAAGDDGDDRDAAPSTSRSRSRSS